MFFLTSHRYYSALKTMEQLENVYFPRVSQYRFCQLMIENLPKLREDIKEISMSDLKDFLESIRKHSDKIGETAMKQVRIQRRILFIYWNIIDLQCCINLCYIDRSDFWSWKAEDKTLYHRDPKVLLSSQWVSWSLKCNVSVQWD